MHAIEIDATLKLAKAKLRSGPVQEAAAMYRRVLQAQADCAQIIRFLGVSAMQCGNPACK